MKLSRVFAFLVAAVAVAAVSCSDRPDDVLFSADRPITLNPKTLTVSTRAAIDGSVFPDDRTIVLSAYLNAVSGTSTNLFSGVTFEKEGSVWSADKYWPMEGTLDMFAYSADGLTLTDVTYSTKVSDGVSVSVPDNSSTQCDILLAASSAQEYSSSGTSLAFRHSQAMLVWTAGANIAYDAATNQGVTITKITLKNAKYSGTLAMTAAAVSGSYCTWSDLGSKKDKDLPGLTSYNVPATPMDITADGNHMGIGGVGIMVPEQTQTAFVIAYTLHGGKDAGGNAVDVYKTVTYPCAGDWIEGNKYNYVMTFNVVNNALEVTASVADWTVEPKAISFPEPVAATYSVVSGTSVSLPAATMSAGCEVAVDWGDGTLEAYVSSSSSKRTFSHTYSSAYTGDVSLVVRAGSLDFGKIGFDNYEKFTVSDGDKVKVKPINALIFRASGEQSVGINGVNTLVFQYSYDGKTWSNYNNTSLSFGTSKQPYIYIRGKNTRGLNTGDTGCCQFFFEKAKAVACSGNVMSLLDWEDDDLDVIPCDYCFCYLFRDCVQLISAPILPATNLKVRCYYGMFTCCTSLTSAPELPATNLDYGCYEYMFIGCSSLTTAPVLPATELMYGCYSRMFSGCSSLTTAPELPATVLPDNCYSFMFSDCSKLQSVTMPATQIGYESIDYWLVRAGSSATNPTLYVPSSMVGNKAITNNKGNFTVQAIP